MLNLEVKPRDLKESTGEVRSRGAMPAVLYGPKQEALSIVIDARRFANVWREAGVTTVITLQGEGEDKDTLIYDVQVHPVTSLPLHADFYVLEKGKKIQIKVPLIFEGVPPAEKAGHILVKALHEIEIEVSPAQLPHDLPVDISNLAQVGDHITAAQIIIPSSATLVTSPEEIIVSVIEFKEEKIEEPTPAAAEGVEGAAEGAVAEGESAEGSSEKTEKKSEEKAAK